MIRRLLLLNGVLLALVLALRELDRAREVRDAVQRDRASAFHAVLDARTPLPAQVARIAILLPGEKEAWRFEKREEGWRIPQHHSAFAVGQGVDALLAALLESRGTIVGSLEADAAHFGFLPGKQLEIILEDSGGRRLGRLLAGTVAAGQRGQECYLAADGLPRILHMDANPWPTLAWAPGASLPPLLDRRVVPLAYGRGYPVKLLLDGPAAPAVREIERREIPLDRLQPGLDRGPRFEWYGSVEGKEQRLNDAATGEFVSHVTGLVHEQILGPDDPRARAIQEPLLRITIEYGGITRDELTVGRPAAGGPWTVRNGTTGQVFLVEESAGAALSPVEAALLAPNPPPPARPPGPPGIPGIPGAPGLPGIPGLPGGPEGDARQ